MGVRELLAPRTLALVGASEKSAFARAVWSNLAGSRRTAARLHLVHPTTREVFDRPCHPSIAEIDERIDCAVVCVRRERVPDVLADAAAAGVPAAVVFATGFEESADDTGPTLARRVRDIGLSSGLAVAGPNCLGVANLLDGVTPYSGGIPEDLAAGRVAIVSQSGGLLAVLLEAAAVRGVGIGVAVSSGNETVTSMAHYTRVLADDDRVEVIGLVVEGFRDGPDMLAATRHAVKRGKRVVFLKLGRAAAGMRAARSHTGNLGTSYERFRGVVEQCGGVLADDLPDFLTALILVSALHGRAGRVAVVACSGGTAALGADLAERRAVPLSTLEDATTAKLAAVLPEHAAIGNPVDLITPTAESAGAVLDALDSDDGVDAMLVALPLFRTPERTVPAIAAVARAATNYRGRTPLVAATVMPGTVSAEWARTLGGCPLVDGLDIALTGVGNVLRQEVYLRSVARRSGGIGSRPETGLAVRAWSEQDLLAELSARDFPVVEQRHLDSESELSSLDDAGLRFPVVVKVDSPDVPHKSHAGGVRTGVGSLDELASALPTIRGDVLRHVPSARIRGFLVQRQVVGDVRELFVGGVRDPALGPLIAVGLGGTNVESLGGARFMSARFLDGADVRSAVLTSGMRSLVDGGYDVDAFVALVVRVARLFEASDGIAELDLNPVLLGRTGEGLWLVDALAEPADQQPSMTREVERP
ncbi:acetate--CoA ligase family protein [Actinophytocola sp.]|uniref:acetate--CoA ligase family protein n=1 Tax=Actinophytocola sp. TaxID=1872138 RepID=UPI003D6AA7AD